MSMTLLLHTPNLDETRDFYGSLLGFDVEDSADGTLTAGLAGNALIFTQRNLWRAPPGASGTIYFTVPDADAYCASIGEKVDLAWPLQTMSYGSREFGLRDCNGYLLAFRTGLEHRLSDVRKKLVVDNADFRESAFTNVNLQQAVFSDVKLSGASFANADLSDVRIDDANTAGMRIDGVLVADLFEAYRGRD